MLTPTSGSRNRLPFEAGRRVLDVAAVVESALDEQAAGADRFRIFGDERPLLRERQDWLQQQQAQPHTRTHVSSELSPAVDEHRDGPVVDQLDLHHGLELAGRDGEAG